MPSASEANLQHSAAPCLGYEATLTRIPGSCHASAKLMVLRNGRTHAHAMQAFRHLYVLAAEPRSVEAIDVDSRASVYVPLTISLGSTHQVYIPVPPSSCINSLDTCFP